MRDFKMAILRGITVTIPCAAVFLMNDVFGADDPSLRLWYRQPATSWNEALPVGNGRLGAMVFGGTSEERVQFNEDTLWTGKPHEYQHEGAVKFLPELRRLLAEGKQKEAEDLAMREFMSVPLRQKAYQPFGDVLVRFAGHENATDYRRELDLDSAAASVRYRVGDVAFSRETFSSNPDQVLVERIAADKAGSVSCRVKLASLHPSALTRVIGSDELALTGRVQEDGLAFEARLRVVAQGGRLTAGDDFIDVAGADSVTLLVVAATSFNSFQDISGDPASRSSAAMRAVAAKDFANLRAAHLADHQKLFRRVSLDLGTSAAAALPTDERLAASDKSQDPQLASLVFQFGRYLLIASSRPGDQPANLQGIWNDKLRPSWDSKYTVNINTEMNYWPAEVANLAECAEPLFAMLDDLVVSGSKTAQAHYGARGWVLHHNTDLWRGTAPINASNHGIWPTGGAWLCENLYEHYRFSGDRKFLARAYPILKGAALFFVDYLVRDPKTGWLISGPSNSPEQGGLVMGPTMDHQIIRNLFGATAEAAGTLGVDKEFAAQLTTMRAQIAPNQIGSRGQLREWLHDVDDSTNTHRHVSHLWGVFPGTDITTKTPETFAAAKQSLLFRGDDGTGWSLGWKICFWARFLDGDHALTMIHRQLRLVREEGTTMEKGGGTYPNLFDAHPPFQIDGNFAATAGMCEMLLQSHDSEIVFLPALPSTWAAGSVAGLRARGGFEVDFAWSKGALTHAVVRSSLGGAVRVRTGSQTTTLTTMPGGSYRLDSDLKTAVAPAVSVTP